ncbi:hypothetical protein HON22_02315 [Candidatus Peregrinibacteria bacterium]|jgi:hypothetical protein|nr:hypothetical protein [Candidatus Peregrinibacteria bacterium]
MNINLLKWGPCLLAAVIASNELIIEDEPNIKEVGNELKKESLLVKNQVKKIVPNNIMN